MRNYVLYTYISGENRYSLYRSYPQQLCVFMYEPDNMQFELQLETVYIYLSIYIYYPFIVSIVSIHFVVSLSLDLHPTILSVNNSLTDIPVAPTSPCKINIFLFLHYSYLPIYNCNYHMSNPHACMCANLF